MTKNMRERPFNPFCCSMPAPGADLRRLNDRFETYADADAERNLRIQHLRQADSEGAIHVADELATCATGRRCVRSDCSICFGRFRLWLTEQKLEFWPDNQELTFLTLIPSNLAVGAGDLAQVSPVRMSNMLSQQLSRVGISGPIIGGIDGEFDRKRALWQPHFHLIAPSRLDQKFAVMRKRFYRPASGIYRPLVRTPVQNRPKQFSYCLKSYWPERVHFTTDRGRNWSKHVRLLEPRHVEWLIWRHQYYLTDFLFLSGVRRRGCRLQLGG